MGSFDAHYNKQNRPLDGRKVMEKINVAQFAGELGLPVELLLEQLQSAGVSKQKDSDPI